MGFRNCYTTVVLVLPLVMFCSVLTFSVVIRFRYRLDMCGCNSWYNMNFEGSLSGTELIYAYMSGNIRYCKQVGVLNMGDSLMFLHIASLCF